MAKTRRKSKDLENTPRKTAEKKTENPLTGFLNEKIDRRKALSTMGKAAAGVAAVAVVAAVGVAAYEVTKAPATVTQTNTVSTTNIITSSVSASSTSESPQEKAARLATAKPGENFIIGFDTFFLSLEASTIMAKSITQACNALGLTASVKDAGLSVTAPIDNARTMISQGAKGIIGFGGNPASYYEVANICQQAGVFFFSLWDMEPFSQPWNTGDYFVAWAYQDGETDLYTSTTLLMEKLKENNKPTGPIMNLQGDSSFSNCIKNFGITDAWNNYQDMTFVGHQYTNWDASQATQDMATQLSLTPAPVGITAVNDTLTAGAIAASKAANDDLGPYAVGPDGSQSAMTLAAANDFLAIGASNDTFTGGLATCMLYDVITGAYYPTTQERLVCTNDFLIAADVNEVKSLASSAGLNLPSNYPVVSATDYLNEIYTAATYPYDWTVVSRGKAQELGKTYDPSGGVTVDGYKMGGFHSWFDVMGNGGGSSTGDYEWSVYLEDCINRFSNLNANSYSDLSKAPFAAGSTSPGIHTWNWYLGKPPTTPL